MWYVSLKIEHLHCLSSAARRSSLINKSGRQRSQVEIARELGISYQAYQKLENPRKCNPTIKTLERISEVLGKHLEINFA